MHDQTTDDPLKREQTATPGALDSLERSIVLRFEQMADLYPDHIAVKDRDQAMTYRDVNARANRLAEIVLEHRGGEDGAPLGFLLGQDVGSIVTVMGILKAGQSFVALHPENPADRLKAIISSAGITCLISTRQYQPLIDEIAADGPAFQVLYMDEMNLASGVANPGIYVGHDAPFYIVYTSGSTGEPKGLLYDHGLTIMRLLPHIHDWQLSPSDRVSLFTSNSFGASIIVMMDALLNGGALCLFDFKNRGAESALDWIRSEQISVLRLTPSVLRAIFETAPPGLILPGLRVVTLTGESTKANDVALFMAHTAEHCRLVNIYGQSEAGVVATYTIGHSSPIPDGDLPAGYLMPGYEVMLLDSEGQPVESGEAGEIVVKSRHVSRGYWRQPELTAEKFLAVPGEPDVKIFHTGDLGRWRADGMLEHLGRTDFQVKIRGQRVELSEVELALRQHPAIKDAVVGARPAKHQPDQLQLIAHVVAHPGRIATASELRRFLAEKLPDYSIPSFYVSIEQLPLTASGKVDRRALPDVPEREALSAADLPSDDTQRALVEIWSRLLHVDILSVHDNFFELGGDSLLVLSMTLEVERTLQGTIPQSFFKEATISNLARSIQEGNPDQTEPPTDFFLQGYRDPMAEVSWKRFRAPRGLRARATRSAGALRRGVGTAYLFEWILSRFMQHLTFKKAKTLILRLADQPLLLNIVYRKSRKVFSRLLDSLGLSSEGSAELFRLNFIANLMHKLVDGKRPFAVAPGARSRDSVYVRDRQRALDSIAAGNGDEHIAMDGFRFLEDAYRKKRGVILLSFHGTAASRPAHQSIARRLGSSDFQVIAHNTALLQSTLWGKRSAKGAPRSSVESAVYAELGFHGQKLLQQGSVILILADVTEGSGRAYPIEIGGRTYVIKAGFAELALNTGAAVIPVHGRYVEDGRLLMTFLPGLEPGTGTRDEQIHALLRQYAEFITEAITQHPEMLLWGRIGQHLRMPRTASS